MQGIIINMEINKLLENKIQAAYGALADGVLSGFSVCRKMTFRANTLKSTEEIVAEELRRAVREAWKIDCWQTKETYEKLYSPVKNYEILKLIYDHVGEQYECGRETCS